MRIEERNTLLILDNFEGLIDDKLCIDLLETLSSIDGSRILVTSRPALRIVPLEKEYKLLPFEKGEAENLFTRLSRKEVRTDEDKYYVRKICEFVHYIPLAIELVSQHTEMGFEQVCDHLEKNRLSLQKADIILAQKRFPDMGFSLLFSYNHLKNPEKRLFLILSIFNGDFTLTAVDAVGEEKDSYRYLQKLCEWKLIRQSGVRYYLLETIKQFSAFKLDEEGMEMGIHKGNTSKKYAIYYLDFLEKHHENPYEIKTEYENIMKSLEWITGRTKREIWARKMLIGSCFRLQEYWRIRGEWKIARGYTEKALEAARIENNLLLEARLLLIICQAGTDLGVFEETHPTLKEALTLVDKLLEQYPEDHETLGIRALLLHQYGRLIDNCVYKLQKIPMLKEYLDAPPPEKYFEESLRIWEDLQDERQIARILQALGFRAMVNDDLERAISLQKQSIDVARRINYRELEGRCLHQMGRIAIKLHSLIHKEYYISPTEIAQIRGQLDKEIRDNGDKNDLRRAAVLLNYAREIAVEIEDQRAESRTRREIGSLKITLAEETVSTELRESLFHEAESELDKALEIAQKINERAGEEKIREELKRLEITRRI